MADSGDDVSSADTPTRLPHRDIEGRCSGIRPVVIFKMLIFGFFDNLPNERATRRPQRRLAPAVRLSLYALKEEALDTLGLSVVRTLLVPEARAFCVDATN